MTTLKPKMHHTMTTEDNNNRKVMTPSPPPPPPGKEMGRYNTKGIFSLGGGGLGTSFS